MHTVKVFLHLSLAGLYYAGGRRWVRERERALDLETVERARAVGHDEDLDSLVAVISSGDPSSDWFVPLGRERADGFPAATTNAQVRLPKVA